MRNVEGSSVNSLSGVSGDLVKAYGEFITTQPTDGERRRLYADSLARAMKRRLWAKDQPVERLIATGELSGGLTSFDVPQKPAEEIPLENEARGLMQRGLYLEMLNHPAVIEAEKKAIVENPHGKVTKRISLVERLEKEGIAVAFTSFGLEMVEADTASLTPRSVRQILGFGLHTHLTRNEVILPFILPSMPTTAGAHSLATLALAGSMGFIPTDAQYRDVQNKIILAERIKELIYADPLLEGHQEGEYIRERALRRIGATLKADQNAVDQARQLKNAGVRIFRVYNAQSEIRDMLTTVAALKDAFGDEIQVIVGQVGGPTQAGSLVNAGADALVVGKADGVACTTAQVSGIIPNNPYALHRIIQAGIDVPVWADGIGGGTGIPVVFALGGSGIMTAHSLVGGTIEHPPFGWNYRNQHGQEVKLYRGEASSATKQLGDRLDRAGNPMFTEGVSGAVPATLESTSARLFRMMQGLAIALKFVDAPTLVALIRRESPVLYRVNNMVI